MTTLLWEREMVELGSRVLFAIAVPAYDAFGGRGRRTTNLRSRVRVDTPMKRRMRSREKKLAKTRRVTYRLKVYSGIIPA